MQEDPLEMGTTQLGLQWSIYCTMGILLLVHEKWQPVNDNI
jgi:hypothetical protein